MKSCIALDAAFHGHSRLLPQTPGGNVIALGALAPTTPLDATMLRERIAVLAASSGLDLTPLLERLIEQEDGLPFVI